MVDDRRARIRRNMARAWAYAAAAYAASVSTITNVQYDFAGGSVAVGTTYGDFTNTLAAAGPPALTDIGTNISIARTVGATEYFTTASVSVGTASANRRVFIAAIADGTFNNRLVKASIGGVAATIHYAGTVTFGDAIGVRFIISAVVPSGTIVGMSTSFSSGVVNGTLRGRVFTADNSLFSNPSPTVVVDSKSVTAGGRAVITATTSANAVVIAVGRGAVAITQESTLSHNIAVATLINPGGFCQRILYANSVSAQNTIAEFSGITATDASTVALMVWR